MKSQYTLYLDDELMKRIKEIATKQGRSVSWLINEHLNKIEKENQKES